MGILKNLKEKKKRERERERDRERCLDYAEYLMNKIPPDYDEALKQLSSISQTLTQDAVNILALCYAEADEGGSISKAREITEPIYERTRKLKDEDGILPYELINNAIYEWAMGWHFDGEELGFEHLKKGAEIVIPDDEPEYFRVIPQFCRARMAYAYYKGEGIDKNIGEAKKICSDILDNTLIPEGYAKKYELVKLILENILKDEEIARHEEEIAIHEEEVARQNAEIREVIEGLLKLNPPSYRTVKETLEGFGYELLPDVGKLYLAISILKELEQKSELTEEQKKDGMEKASAILDSIETDSAALWYYRSLGKSGDERAECLRRGARYKKETNIFDKESRKICLINYADHLFDEAKALEIDFMKIESGAGSEIYNEMTGIAAAFSDASFNTDLDLWKKTSDEHSGALHSYSRYAISALVKKYDKKNNDRAQRRRFLLERFSAKELMDYGFFNFKDNGDNKYIGYLFFDALLHDKEKAENELSGDEITTVLNYVIVYCLNNDDMIDAFYFGDYALEKRNYSAMVDTHVQAWMLSDNDGYFLTEDRPDEKGRYSDHDRIRTRAFRASVIYDGVLG